MIEHRYGMRKTLFCTIISICRQNRQVRVLRNQTEASSINRFLPAVSSETLFGKHACFLYSRDMCMDKHKYPEIAVNNDCLV